MNNCICSEHEFANNQTYIDMHMRASAQAVADAGFDGVKLDGCGQFRCAPRPLFVVCTRLYSPVLLAR